MTQFRDLFTFLLVCLSLSLSRPSPIPSSFAYNERATISPWSRNKRVHHLLHTYTLKRRLLLYECNVWLFSSANLNRNQQRKEESFFLRSNMRNSVYGLRYLISGQRRSHNKLLVVIRGPFFLLPVSDNLNFRKSTFHAS